MVTVSASSEEYIPTHPSLTEFTIFPKLPIELRYKIWGLALPGPRVVNIGARRCFNEYQASRVEGGEIRYTLCNPFRFQLSFCPDNSLIGMLNASRESRKIAIESLPIRLPSNDDGHEIRVGTEDAVCIKDLDLLLAELLMATKLGIELPPGLKQLHTLAIVQVDAGDYEFADFHDLLLCSKNLLHKGLAVFKGLRVVLLVGDETGVTRDGGDFNGFVQLGSHDLALDFDQFRLAEEAEETAVVYRWRAKEWNLKNGGEAPCPGIKIMIRG